MKMMFTMALTMLVLAGCSGSGGSTDGSNPSNSTGAPPSGSLDAQTTPDFPPGKFTVQLGAFQSSEGAENIASVTKSRFSKEVYTVVNDADGLYKVMLGVFDTKDLARAFRDTIVRQYPDDYRDAWVSELAK